MLASLSLGELRQRGGIKKKAGRGELIKLIMEVHVNAV